MTIVFATTESYPRTIESLQKLAELFQETRPHIIVEVQQPHFRSGITMKDVAEGADMIMTVTEEMGRDGIQIHLAQVHKSVITFLKEDGVDTVLKEGDLEVMTARRRDFGDPIVACKGVRFEYERGIEVLRGVDLELRRGEVLALV